MNCNGLYLDLSTPKIMGILNATPNSFYDNGKYNTLTKQLNQVEKLLNEGADIIDIGGASTKPNADIVSETEEINRIEPLIKKVKKLYPKIILSIDTYRASVAEKTYNLGANIINDISAGGLDEKMFETVAKIPLPYIMMHIKGNPQNMQNNPHYENITKEIKLYFSDKIKRLTKLNKKDIIIDPGFGFGKTVEHNYEILNNLSEFKKLKKPILVGLSRKSMIYKVLNTDSANALNGTTALNAIALLKGANILRVHDVKEAKEIVSLVSKL